MYDWNVCVAVSQVKIAMCHAWRVLVAALGDHTFSQQLREEVWDNMLESCAVSVVHMLQLLPSASF